MAINTSGFTLYPFSSEKDCQLATAVNKWEVSNEECGRAQIPRPGPLIRRFLLADYVAFVVCGGDGEK